MATLKDLSASEKAKVSRLIQQIVEQEQQIQALQQEHSRARQLAEEVATQQQVLQEQNASVARDNTSLRAKLTHAFALLKTYQHKVRVLHAALQVSQAHGDGGNSGGKCGTEQEADGEGPGGDELLAADWPSAGDCSQAGEGQQQGGLSPIREASGEGSSPSPKSARRRTAGRASAWLTKGAGAGRPPPGGTGEAGPPPYQEWALRAAKAQAQAHQAGPQHQDHSLQQPQQAQQPQQPLQQPLHQHLEPLTLLARALLEAQAEMMLDCVRQQDWAALHGLLAARQQQHQEQQLPPPPQPEAGCASQASSCTSQGQGQDQEAPVACDSTWSKQGGGCAGKAGGKENSPLLRGCEGDSSRPQRAQRDQQFIVSCNTSTSSTSSEACSSCGRPLAKLQEGPALHRPPAPSVDCLPASQAALASQPPWAWAAAPQPPHAEPPRQLTGGAASGFVLGQFHPSLLDIVAEVEGMQLSGRGRFSWGTASASEADVDPPWHSGCGWAAAGGSSSTTGGGGAYEESDLLSIIAALE